MNYENSNNDKRKLNLNTKNKDFVNIVSYFLMKIFLQEKSQEKINIRGPILFDDAISYLHRQLHSIDLEE